MKIFITSGPGEVTLMSTHKKGFLKEKKLSEFSSYLEL